MGLGLSTPGTTGLNGDTMTDEEFLLHIGGMVKDISDNTADRVNVVMELIANRLNEINSRTISYDDIARLEKRISDLENR